RSAARHRHRRRGEPDAVDALHPRDVRRRRRGHDVQRAHAFLRMTDPHAYIHGSTDAREIARLEKQAAFVAPWSLARFDCAPVMRVLDLGTGIGAMAAQLARRYPGIQLTGLDRSPAQLAVARHRHPVAEYVEGDATALPFEAATFDRVHATWLLEHVPDPL